MIILSSSFLKPEVDELDTTRFIARLLELYFITKQYNELDENQPAKISIKATKTSFGTIKAELEKLRVYIIKQIPKTMIKRVLVLLEMIRYNMIADFFSEQEREDFYKAKIIPNNYIIDYFIDFLTIPERSRFKLDYRLLDKAIISRIKDYIFIIKDDSIQGLVTLFMHLANAKLITRNFAQERAAIYDKVDEFFIENKSDAKLLSILESRWGRSRWSKNSKKQQLESIDKRQLYYFIKDWEYILETENLADPETFRDNLHALLSIYYPKWFHVTISDLSSLNKK